MRLIRMMPTVVLLLAAVPAAAQDYQISLRSQPGSLDSSRQAALVFDVTIHPASTVQQFAAPGRLCVAPAESWEWAAPVAVPPLQRGETKQVTATLRGRGTWTGSRAAAFTAASPGGACSASGFAPAGGSNRVDATFSTAAPMAGTVAIPTPAYDLDIVEVQSVSVSPQPAYRNQQLTVKMTVRYKGAQGLAGLQVRVRRGGQVLGQMVRPNVAARSTFDITATWVATPGPHTFFAEVDVDNLLKEGSASFQNNTRSVTVNVLDADGPAPQHQRTSLLTGPIGPNAPGGQVTSGVPVDRPIIAGIRQIVTPGGWVGIALVCNAKSSIAYKTERDGRIWFYGTPGDFLPGNFTTARNGRCPADQPNPGSFEVQFSIDKWPVETCYVEHTFKVSTPENEHSFAFRTAGRDRCKGPRPPYIR